MKKILFALMVASTPIVAHADELYRWTDERGVLHYSNVAAVAPAGATVVTTPITLEVAQLPGGTVDQPRHTQPYRPIPRDEFRGYAAPNYVFRPLPDAPRVYDERRLMFGCFTAGVLYSGGFSHADDISSTLNCLPYRLGPEAWLNAARAELAMRQNGINPRDMMRLYEEGPRELGQPYEERR
jgi:hypothetical protein